ncbi:MAG TPA: sigma-70 family RNA polymerase sigma factor [Flavitalea sp.]|nr:sigma-70 family RNA polymerase sigma factor [Flavitalea sp.]
MHTSNPSFLHSEEQLINSLRNHDEKAFRFLYDHYAGALNRIIRNVIQDEETANDTLQKVFITIWQKISGYEPAKGRLFTWMLHIARNASIDTIRSKSYRHQKLVHSIEDKNFAAVDINPFDRSDAIGLQHFVSRLKPQQRQLVKLVYFQGYTQSEIAKMLQIPLSTVKTRIRAAMTQLRVLLGKTETSGLL